MFAAGLRFAFFVFAFSTSILACKSIDSRNSENISGISSHDETPSQCWRQSYGRGVGTIPGSCPDSERNGALCYPLCKDGYKGVGPVCWQRCEEGFTDDGAFCRRPKPLKIVAKKSYGRTAGTLMHCGDDKEKDAGLCYKQCKPGYNGVGPVCWQKCPASHPVDCAAGCTTTKEACGGNILESLKSIGELIKEAISRDAAATATATGEVVKSFNFSKCEDPA